MNIYKTLNEITEYIENHLEEDIDYNVLSKMMGVNSYTMQKIFSLLTNIPLSEYIRKRRLSNAGFDLYNSKLKVMDVAVKYRYDNSTSFSRAFEAFHGIKPSMVNKTSKLKNFPRITFNESVMKEANSFDYKIIELEKMTLYGIGVKTDNIKIKKDAPKLFKEVKSKYKNILGDIKYGMVTYESRALEICNGYYVLYDKNYDGFEKVEIPEGKWLVFRINSQDAKEIQEMSETFYMNFLPSCKYNLKETPELEYYHDDVTDFLVPIY